MYDSFWVRGCRVQEDKELIELYAVRAFVRFFNDMKRWKLIATSS